MLISLFMACDAVTVNEYETQFNVYTVLINRRSNNEVFVDRTYDIDEPSEPYVDDAFVTLSTSNTVDTLVFIYDRYITSYMDIHAGETYYLEISKQGFDTLFGVTQVPGEFEFMNQPNDTITLEDTIFFEQSIGAIVYYCLFISLESYEKDELWLKPDTLDSLVKIRVGDYIGNLPDGFCRIIVKAFDRNYYKYTFEPDDSLRQDGVTGGIGLCGSAWCEDITLYLNIPE